MKQLKPMRLQRILAFIPAVNIVAVAYLSFFNAVALKKLNPHLFTTIFIALTLGAVWTALLVLTLSLPGSVYYLVPLAILSTYALPGGWLLSERAMIKAATLAQMVFVDDDGHLVALTRID